MPERARSRYRATVFVTPWRHNCLNADADLSTIQDLLGHTHITTTQRYCRVSNLKVQRDYYNAIELVMQRSQAGSR